MGLWVPLLQHKTEVIFKIKKAYDQMHTKRFILYLLSYSVQKSQDHESAFNVNLKHYESKPDHTLGKRYCHTLPKSQISFVNLNKFRSEPRYFLNNFSFCDLPESN